MTLTKDQAATLRHMLGLPDRYDRRQTEYRNYFAANPGDPDLAELGRLGLAVKRRNPTDWMPYEIWRCTDAGRAAARASQKPDLSSSKRRYMAWLDLRDACPDLTFREFLTDPEYAEYRNAQ